MRLIKRSDAPDAPYYVVFQHRGKKYQRSTEQTTKELAERRAKQILGFVQDGKWREYADTKLKRTGCTIQEAVDMYLEANIGVKPESKAHNVTALKAILATVGRTMEDPLTIVDDELAAKYADAVLARKYESSDAKISAVNTACSYLAQARSIFKYERRAFSGISLPEGLTLFKGVKPAELGLRRLIRTYVPITEEGMGELMKAARDLDKETYKAFLLAIAAGFRAGEIMAARWTWLQGDSLQIPVANEFTPKGRSGRTIPLSPAVVKELKDSKTDPEWIIGGKNKSERHAYVYRSLSQWLRSRGFKGSKSTHQLRKQFGSLVATQQGLFAAKTALGHKHQSVTESHYASLSSPLGPVTLAGFGD